MAEGLPERNVNTTCPMLTLLCVYEDTQDERYGALCRDWAEWVMHGLIRTGDGAFQHMITGDANDSQMLIDTLFMTVLFLAKAGVVFGRKDYVEEAKRQCLVHIKYLYDTSCGLYFHGYDFKGRHNYGRVHWARGNSWYTCGIMELIGLIPIEPGLRQYFLDTFRAQVDALCACQAGTACGIRSWTTRRLIRKARPRRRLPTECSRASVWAFCPRSMRRRPCAPCRPCWPAWMPRASWAAFPTARLWAMTHSFYKDIPVCPMTYGQAMAILMLGRGAVPHRGGRVMETGANVPLYGPYSKKYLGLSKIVPRAQAPGARFDLVVHPTCVNGCGTVPNTTFPCGYHPWQAAPDGSFYSYRCELLPKDRLYASIAFFFAWMKTRGACARGSTTGQSCPEIVCSTISARWNTRLRGGRCPFCRRARSAGMRWTMLPILTRSRVRGTRPLRPTRSKKVSSATRRSQTATAWATACLTPTCRALRACVPWRAGRGRCGLPRRRSRV